MTSTDPAVAAALRDSLEQLRENFELAALFPPECFSIAACGCRRTTERAGRALEGLLWMCAKHSAESEWSQAVAEADQAWPWPWRTWGDA